MSDRGDQIRAANDRLARLVEAVCGQCADSCCHQGTMMGMQGLRRLTRGVALEAGLAQRLRAGLQARREELAHDLRVVSRVSDLLRATDLPDEAREALPELDKRIADLRRLVEYLGTDFALDVAGMTPLLHYTAVRHNLLRCLHVFPGAEAALSTLSRGQGSFAFRGRKQAPPRCIFHEGRCLAEAYKPVKCASFFCTNEPNLLARCRELMSFDEFVLAHARAVGWPFVVGMLELEGRLGQEYWEPKVFLGPDAGTAASQDALITLLTRTRPRVKVQREPGRFMKATNEILSEVLAAPPEQTLIYAVQSVDGAALYELAVAMDRARNQDWQGGFVLLAQQLADKSFLPHPLWEDQMISQPLGGLEVYYRE